MYQAAHEADKGIIAFIPLAQMALKWVLKAHVVQACSLVLPNHLRSWII